MDDIEKLRKMLDVKKLMVPWLEGLRPYFSEHIERTWEDRNLTRMMINENPFPPQKEILESLIEGRKVAKRYPGFLLKIKKRIGEINSGWQTPITQLVLDLMN